MTCVLKKKNLIEVYLNPKGVLVYCTHDHFAIVFPIRKPRRDVERGVTGL